MQVNEQAIKALSEAVDAGLLDAHQGGLCLYRIGNQWVVSDAPDSRVKRQRRYEADGLADVLQKAGQVA